MSADQGQDIRDMAALQARVSDCMARLVMLESRVDALEGTNVPSKPEAVDPGMPEADLLTMRERLKSRSAAGMEKHRADPEYAGDTFRREAN